MSRISNIAIMVIACCCLLACSRWAAPQGQGPRSYLVATDYARTGCLSYPVSAGDEFVLEYFHSYSKFPVREMYIVHQEQTIELHQIVQKASQCSSIIYPEVRLRDDGWVEINNIHRLTPEISFISGSPDLGDHQLEINGQVIRLADTFEGGSEIIISISTFDPCSVKVQK